jgi:integrase/recombinase XerD
MSSQISTKIRPGSRLLSAAEFYRLADVPPEVEWFANLSNAHTRRAYEGAVQDFMRFAGIVRPEEFRTVTRARVIAWRDDLRTRLTARGKLWSDASIRHRLSALAALFEYLCGRNAVTHNPVKGVERPKSETGEGKTPAFGDHQARELLAARWPTARAASATAPFFRRFSMHCGATSYASSRSGTSSTRAKACRI